MPKTQNERLAITAKNQNEQIAEIESREVTRDSHVAFQNGLNFILGTMPLHVWPMNIKNFSSGIDYVEDITNRRMHLNPIGITQTTVNSIKVATFDGSTSIAVGASMQVYSMTSNQSIAAWVRKPTGHEGFIGGAYTDSSLSTGRTWGVSLGSGNALNFYECPGDGNLDQYASTLTAKNDQWSFVVAARDTGANVIRYFIDGEYETVTRGTGSSAVYEWYTTLGAIILRSTEALSKQLNGELSVVAMWDFALSENEMRAIYNIMKPAYLYG